MKKIFYISACIVALAINGCDKFQIKQVGDTATGVKLKFFHAAPGCPGLDAYVNGVQLTPTQAVSVTDNFLPGAITTGYVYNGVFPGSNYMDATPGSTAIKIVASTPVPALISAQTVAPGTVITNVTQTTADGDSYSVITSGLAGSVATPLTSFIVKDVFPDAVAGKAYVRLAHMIPNGGAVDMGASYTPTGASAAVVTTPISNQAYGSFSSFTPVDMNSLSTTTYTFQAYLTGTTTKLGGSVAVAMTPGRYYTIVLKGLAADYPVPSTSITLKASARPTAVTDPTRLYPEIYFNAPGLTFYTNK
jgi:hypothetical protein